MDSVTAILSADTLVKADNGRVLRHRLKHSQVFRNVRTYPPLPLPNRSSAQATSVITEHTNAKETISIQTFDAGLFQCSFAY